MDERSRVVRTAALWTGGVWTAIAGGRGIQLLLELFPFWVRIPGFIAYGGLIFVACLVVARRAEK